MGFIQYHLSMNDRFLQWCRSIQSISQNGLAFTKDSFDKERYEQLRSVADEMLASCTDIPVEKIKSLLSSEKGYATPKVDVRGGVFRGDKILLVRERSDNAWTLPGGWADVNESPSESIVREIREESGFKTKCVKLAAVYDRDKHAHTPFFFSVYKLFFICKLIGGKPEKTIETDGVAFFAEDGLPNLSETRVTPSQIQMVFRHHRNIALPAEFD
jgi:ADP-ribose pyrophosphatase YjhB (NUDIX family)